MTSARVNNNDSKITSAPSSTQTTKASRSILSMDELKMVGPGELIHFNAFTPHNELLLLLKNFPSHAHYHLTPTNSAASALTLFESLVLKHLPAKTRVLVGARDVNSLWTGEALTTPTQCDLTLNGCHISLPLADENLMVNATKKIITPWTYFALPPQLEDKTIIEKIFAPISVPFMLLLTHLSSPTHRLAAISCLPKKSSLALPLVSEEEAGLIGSLLKNTQILTIFDKISVKAGIAAINALKGDLQLSPTISPENTGLFVAALKNKESKLEITAKKIMFPAIIDRGCLIKGLHSLPDDATIIFHPEIKLIEALIITASLKNKQKIEFPEGIDLPLRLNVIETLHQREVVIAANTDEKEAQAMVTALPMGCTLSLPKLKPEVYPTILSTLTKKQGIKLLAGTDPILAGQILKDFPQECSFFMENNDITCVPGTPLENLIQAAKSLAPKRFMNLPLGIDPCPILQFIPENSRLLFPPQDLKFSLNNLKKLPSLVSLVEPGKRCILPNGISVKDILNVIPHLKPGTILVLPETLTSANVIRIAEILPDDKGLEFHFSHDIHLPGTISVSKAQRAASALHPGRRLCFANNTPAYIAAEATLHLSKNAILDLPALTWFQEEMKTIVANLRPERELSLPLLEEGLVGELINSLSFSCRIYLSENQNILLPAGVSEQAALNAVQCLLPKSTIRIHPLTNPEVLRILAENLPYGCLLDIPAEAHNDLKLMAVCAIKNGRLQLDGDLTIKEGMLPEQIERAVHSLKPKNTILFEGEQDVAVLKQLKLPQKTVIIQPTFKTLGDTIEFVSTLKEDTILQPHTHDEKHSGKERLTAIKNLPQGSTLRLSKFQDDNKLNKSAENKLISHVQKLPVGCKLDITHIFFPDPKGIKKSILPELKPGCIVILPEKPILYNKKIAYFNLIDALPDETILEIQHSIMGISFQELIQRNRNISIKLADSLSALDVNEIVHLCEHNKIILHPTHNIHLKSTISRNAGIHAAKALHPGRHLSLNIFQMNIEDAIAIANALPNGCILMIDLYQLPATLQKFAPFFKSLKNCTVELIKDAYTINRGMVAEYLDASVNILLSDPYLPTTLPNQCSILTGERLAKALSQAAKKKNVSKHSINQVIFKLNDDAEHKETQNIVKHLSNVCTLDLSDCKSSQTIQAALQTADCHVMWATHWSEDFSSKLCESLKSRSIILPHSSFGTKTVSAFPAGSELTFLNLTDNIASVFASIPEDCSVRIPKPATNETWVSHYVPALQSLKANRIIIFPTWLTNELQIKAFLSELKPGVLVKINSESTRAQHVAIIRNMPLHCALMLDDDIDPVAAGVLVGECYRGVHIRLSKNPLVLLRGTDPSLAINFAKMNRDNKTILTLPSAPNKSNYDLLTVLNTESWFWTLPENISRDVAYHFIKNMPDIRLQDLKDNYKPHSDKLVEAAVEKAFQEKLAVKKTSEEIKEEKTEVQLSSDVDMVDTSAPLSSTSNITVKLEQEMPSQDFVELKHPFNEATLCYIADKLRRDPVTNQIIPAKENCNLLVAAFHHVLRTGEIKSASPRTAQHQDCLLRSDTSIERRDNQLYVVRKNTIGSLLTGYSEGVAGPLSSAPSFVEKETIQEMEDKEFKSSSTVRVTANIENQEFNPYEIHIDDLASFLAMKATQEKWVAFCISLSRKISVTTDLATSAEVIAAARQVRIGHAFFAYASVVNGKPSVYFIDPQKLYEGVPINKAVSKDIKTFYKFDKNQFDTFVNLIPLESQVSMQIREKNAKVRVKEEKADVIMTIADARPQGSKRAREGKEAELGHEHSKKTTTTSSSSSSSSVSSHQISRLFASNPSSSSTSSQDVEMGEINSDLNVLHK